MKIKLKRNRKKEKMHSKLIQICSFIFAIFIQICTKFHRLSPVKNKTENTINMQVRAENMQMIR